MKSSTQILIIVFVFIFSSGVCAQTFQFGLQSGLNISNTHLVNKDVFTDQNRIYYPLIFVNGNVYAEYKSGSFWGVSFEPGFIQKGGLQKDVSIRTETLQFLPQDVKYVSSFIQFPVLMNFYFTKSIYASIGPEFSFLLSSKAKGEYFTSDVSDGHAKLELSGIAGITCSPFKFIDIGLRYNHGITCPGYLIWEDDFGNYIGRSKQYYQYFQFLIRIKTGWK